jgi:hypothetical protein
MSGSANVVVEARYDDARSVWLTRVESGKTYLGTPGCPARSSPQ